MKYQDYPLHDSMRGWFGRELYFQMKENKDIFLLVGDLGYGMFDLHRRDFEDRFINCGAAEQAMVDISIGLALEGKIPFVYSITPFLIYRPFESLRTYVNHENIPIKLIGSGRDKDYIHDGWSHNATDVKKFLNIFKNIELYFPTTKESMPLVVKNLVVNQQPSFLSLKR